MINFQFKFTILLLNFIPISGPYVGHFHFILNLKGMDVSGFPCSGCIWTCSLEHFPCCNFTWPVFICIITMIPKFQLQFYLVIACRFVLLQFHISFRTLQILQCSLQCVWNCPFPSLDHRLIYLWSLAIGIILYIHNHFTYSYKASWDLGEQLTW